MPQQGGLSDRLAHLPSPPSQAQEACGPLEIDSALGLVQSLERDLQEAKAAARDGKLKPLPGETVRAQGKVAQVDAGWALEWGSRQKVQPTSMSPLIPPQMEKCAQDLGNSTKAVSSAIAHLLGEVAQGNENYTGTGLHTGAGRGEGTMPAATDLSIPPGIAAREVAQALRSLSQAARGVAASTPDPQAQSAMLECASDVMDKANNLIEEARKAVAKPGDPESQQRLAQVGGVPLTSPQEEHGVGQETVTALCFSAGGQGSVAGPEPLRQLSARAAGRGCCHPHGGRGQQEAACRFGELSKGGRGRGKPCRNARWSVHAGFLRSICPSMCQTFILHLHPPLCLS